MFLSKLRLACHTLQVQNKIYDEDQEAKLFLQEYLFRGIQKQEWNNLFSFLQAKRIRIENIEEAQQGPGGNAPLDFSGLDLGEDIDTGACLTPPSIFGELGKGLFSDSTVLFRPTTNRQERWH